MCSITGLPAGVLSVVNGTRSIVNAICEHPDIKAISFVGGDSAGKHIYQTFVRVPVPAINSRN
jgi:malonate-semialdehyde dehydrogenase (acetylating)/methylmalonate-semialdehyde dehydrogenase